MEEQRRIRLERLLDEFDRRGIGRQVNYGKLRLYSIITHSTALEGSTVTVEENTVMFDDGLPPAGRPVVEQLMNLVQMEGRVVPTTVRSDNKVPLMGEGSTIILNSSVTASLGLPKFSLYIAAFIWGHRGGVDVAAGLITRP